MELIKVIHAELPQIQCGRCDTPGCYQYAEEISKGAPHDRCVPGGDQALGKLNKILNKNIFMLFQYNSILSRLYLSII